MNFKDSARFSQLVDRSIIALALNSLETDKMWIPDQNMRNIKLEKPFSSVVPAFKLAFCFSCTTFQYFFPLPGMT